VNPVGDDACNRVILEWARLVAVGIMEASDDLRVVLFFPDGGGSLRLRVIPVGPRSAHPPREWQSVAGRQSGVRYLAALVEHAGQTVSKEELIARAWPCTIVDEAVLRVNVVVQREALRDGHAGKCYVANNPGRGDTFIAPVTCDEAFSATAAPIAKAGNLPVLSTRVAARGIANLTDNETCAGDRKPIAGITLLDGRGSPVARSETPSCERLDRRLLS